MKLERSKSNVLLIAAAIAALLPAIAGAEPPGKALDAALATERSVSAADDAALGADIRAEAEARAAGDAALDKRLKALEAKAPAPTPTPDPLPAPPAGVLPQGSAQAPILQIGLRDHVDWASQSPYKSHHRFTLPQDVLGLIERGKFDPATGRYTLAAGERLTIGRLRNSQTKGFDIDPGVWCVVAERAGTASVRAGDLKDDGSTPARQRICGDLAGATGAWQVVLDGGSAGGSIGITFWGPAKFEDDPDGWHPAYVRETSRYHIIRGMSWFNPALAKIVRADQWVRDDDYFWMVNAQDWERVPAANDESVRGGYAFGRFFDLANKADAAAWLTLPVYIGAGSVRAELVELNSESNATKRSEEIAAVRAALAANFETYKQDARREWRALADRVIDSAEAYKYPLDKVLLIETGNETWNGGNSLFASQQNWVKAVGAAAGQDDVGYGAGYITAIAVEAFRERFAARRPAQDVKFVHGWHTGAADGVGGFRARNFIAGFKAWKTDSAEDLLQVFGGTTGYWDSDFKWSTRGNPFGAATEAEYNAAFEAADRADRRAMFGRIRDWQLGPAAGDNVARVVANNIVLRDIAIDGGMRGVIQYEGGWHGNVLRGAGQLGAVYPAANEAAVEWNRSAEARQVQAALIAALAAIDPINPAVKSGWAPRTLVIANYHDFGLDLTSGQPWVERSAADLDSCGPAGIAGAWCAAARPRRAAN